MGDDVSHRQTVDRQRHTLSGPHRRHHISGVITQIADGDLTSHSPSVATDATQCDSNDPWPRRDCRFGLASIKSSSPILVAGKAEARSADQAPVFNRIVRYAVVVVDTGGPIPEDLARLIAGRFAALAEPNRVRILDTLQREGELSVSEVAERLDAGYANVAKHLSLLHRERIVSRAKDGTRAVYRITDPSLARLCDEVCGAIAQQHAELSQLLAGHQLSSVTRDTHEEKNR